jgi:hypothetical protein
VSAQAVDASAELAELKPVKYVMEVETLGVARSLGWKVHMRCAHGYREYTRSMKIHAEVRLPQAA